MSHTFQAADMTSSNQRSVPTRLVPGDPVYNDALEFLYTEAELLDENRLVEWLAVLADELSYRMPVRVTRQRGEGDDFARGVTFFDDDLPTLTLRVRRLTESPNAHAEMPATRSRRFVTNVRIAQLGDDVFARSSLLLLSSRWDSHSYEFLAARRNDVLRRFDDGLKLVRREILIDQTVPESPCLSVFL
ncbi:aromatic-ring-hydroxylating dioxygenase subunit beta [Mycobacterium sp.]|uniref:aromatic-ring-hydroxylating dioxygenase subunit beta n=1 Tax=Mycobacterium sp. TaxID=1785 RepID=UPI003C78975C